MKNQKIPARYPVLYLLRKRWGHNRQTSAQLILIEYIIFSNLTRLPSAGMLQTARKLFSQVVYPSKSQGTSTTKLNHLLDVGFELRSSPRHALLSVRMKTMRLPPSRQKRDIYLS